MTRYVAIYHLAQITEHSNEILFGRHFDVFIHCLTLWLQQQQMINLLVKSWKTSTSFRRQCSLWSM